ncbi:MAG: MarC family protein [Candidatus Limnocylindrales bacterium]
MPSPEFAIKAFFTLFVVVDPIGLVPVFIALAGHRSPATQARYSRRAVLIAGGVMVAFAIVGGPLLEYLGISVAALQIAGGILLFKIALDMVYAQVRRETAEEEVENRAKEDVSVFPLAIPLIAGPGTLASVLILVGGTGGNRADFAIVLLMGVVVLLLAYLFLRLSTRIAKLLGQTGINVVTRVLGLILAALSVQYVADGVTTLLRA